MPTLVEARAAPGSSRGCTGRGAPLLSVQDLHLHFVTSRGVVRAVEGISYDVHPGEMIAIVGESGCGKSVSALSIMRLLPKLTARIVGGKILFGGRNLLELSDSEMRSVRGREISMIFQEPMTSLNPVLKIGFQLTEALFMHQKISKTAARERAIELLKMVGIPDPERRLDQYPHQFSGGMRQRVMIAIGLACNPKLIIADEPTTALDVTIQAQILKLMKDLSRDLGIAMIVITHNLGIVARYADRVNVMYAAKMVEQAEAERIFSTPRHPYTIGLLRSVPRLDRPREGKLATIEGLPPNLLSPPSGCRFADRCKAVLESCRTSDPQLRKMKEGQLVRCFRAEEIARDGPAAFGLAPAPGTARSGKTIDRSKPLLKLDRLETFFDVSSGFRLFGGEKTIVKAVNDVSLDIYEGETLGLVGESGCGKTTVGRTILQLEKATGGTIRYRDRDLAQLSSEEMKKVRRDIQVIFQDPFSSLNPRMTIGQIIAEPIMVYKLQPNRKAARERVAELLTTVGLYPYMADRYPHELSGGQRQRVGIARALALEPSFIVCDEPVSALDVSIQAQVINLLEELQERLGLTYLFIAHDLAVVRHISDRVAVMYLGRMMELADRDALYDSPLHPYTKALLDAVPVPDARLEREREHSVLGGEVPSPLRPPQGCVFSTRCPLASEECRREVPALREIRPNHYAACIKL